MEKRRSRRKSNNFKKILTAISLFLIIVALAYLLGFFRKTCFDDECFERSLSDCSPADFVTQRSNNIYIYSIRQSYLDDCNIVIELAKVAPGSEPRTRELLEGNSMECKIPKSFLRNNNLDNLDNILQYCHGQLKEGILELIIEKMYSQIIINLNAIIEESRAFLRDI